MCRFDIWKFLFFHVLLVLGETIGAVYATMGYFYCDDYNWACATIFFTVLPGIVGFSGLLIRDLIENCSQVGLRHSSEWLKYMFFPVYHVTSNLAHLFELRRLRSDDSRYGHIMHHGLTLKLLKATCSSSPQLVLQLAISSKSISSGVPHYPSLVTSALSTLSICYIASKNLHTELCQHNGIPLEESPSWKNRIIYFLYFFISGLPRIMSWALILSFIGTKSLPFILIGALINFTVLCVFPVQYTGWELDRRFMYLFDAASSLTVSIFPQSMTRLTVSTSSLISLFLTIAGFLFHSGHLEIDPNEKHIPIIVCFQPDKQRANTSVIDNVNSGHLFNCVPASDFPPPCEGTNPYDQLMMVYIPLFIGLLITTSFLTIFMHKYKFRHKMKRNFPDLKPSII